MPKSAAAPLKRTKVSEAHIEAVVSKDGKPTEVNSLQIDEEPDEAIKHVNIRLTAGVIRQIDKLRAKRPRKMGSPKLGISLRDWIVEAILEKLKRDRNLG